MGGGDVVLSHKKRKAIKRRTLCLWLSSFSQNETSAKFLFLAVVFQNLGIYIVVP